MTPMIDVVFLLLVFFLTASSFQLTEKMLPSGVSEPSESARGAPNNESVPQELSDVSDVIVRLLSANGHAVEMQINEEPIESIAELTNRLQAIIRVRSDVPIIVEPDAKVPIGKAVAAYDAARTAGAVRVYLTTEK